MKNGKLPTRNQKIMMKSHGLDSEKYLVVKDTQEMMEVVARSDLKKQQIMALSQEQESSIKHKLKGWLYGKQRRYCKEIEASAHSNQGRK